MKKICNATQEYVIFVVSVKGNESTALIEIAQQARDKDL